jgi:hypothetical protein
MNDINTEEPDWESIIIILQAYTRGLIKGKTWFRGKDPESYLKGKEIDDYVYEAIGRYLKNPEKFDSSKGILTDYLKFNVIRSLVANDIRSDENKTTKDVFGIADNLNDENIADNYLESVLPFVEAFFDQQVDYDKVMGDIAEMVEGESEVEQIFVSVYGYGMKRREVIKEFEMSEETYDNAFRRLKTIIKNTVKKFDLTEHKI